jgi:hypothetical protein
MTTVVTMKIALDGRAGTWRRMQVPADMTLYDLAYVICRSFNFDFDHAFGFYSEIKRSNYTISKRKFELFADRDGEGSDGALGVSTSKVADAFPKAGAKMLYLFDYGDEWRFICEREPAVLDADPAIVASGAAKVIASKGKPPVQYPPAEEE